MDVAQHGNRATIPSPSISAAERNDLIGLLGMQRSQRNRIDVAGLPLSMPTSLPLDYGKPTSQYAITGGEGCQFLGASTDLLLRFFQHSVLARL